MIQVYKHASNNIAIVVKTHVLQMGRLENRLGLLLWATTLTLLAALAWETARLRTKLDTLSSQEDR